MSKEIEATEISAKAILSTSVLQTFLGQLDISRVALSRRGRMEMSELIGKTVSFRLPIWPSYHEGVHKMILRSELIAEFEKQGLSTDDAFKVAELFFEMVRKGELK